MKDFKQQVASQIIELMINKDFSPQEEAVLSVLTKCWSGGEVTQKMIIESPEWKKARPLGTTLNSNTSTRKLRKVINSLRTQHKIPVLHNSFGHFLPENSTDLERFMERLEIEVKAKVTSTLETYNVLKDAFKISSKLEHNLDAVKNQIIQIV